MRRRSLTALIVVGLLAAGLPMALAYPRPGETERVSVSTTGEQAGGQWEPNFATDISPEGRYVVFDGWSPKLAPEHDDGGVARSQVYIRDRETGVTELASVNAEGRKADSHSSWGVITPDARYLAFSSLGRNLAPGSTAGAHQIYLRDRVSGAVERVSVNDAGEAGAAPGAFTRADSELPSITPDARHIAFDSRATNLAIPDANGSERDVFVRDRVAQTTQRVSVDSDGIQLTGESFMPQISDDGRFVAFENFSLEVRNVVRVPPREDSVYMARVYLHDRETGETDLVSVASDGASANDHAVMDALTPDGRFVVFSSNATNLVPHTVDPEVLPDCNLSSEEGGFVCRDPGPWHVYVHDRETGVTERVSVTQAGEQGNGPSDGGFISDNGRFVVFLSGATNFVEGDTHGRADIFVHDRLVGTTERVSISTDGEQVRGECGIPTRISGDGRFPAFTCFGEGLVPNSTSDGIDAYVRDRGPALGIGRLSAVSSGGSLLASGWASFSGERLSDASDAVDPESGLQQGTDLSRAELVYAAEGEGLLVRWHLDQLPGGGAPGVVYGLALEVGGESYEIRGTATTSDTLDFALYRCEPTCIATAPVEASYGDVGSQIWAWLLLTESPAQPGGELSGIRAYTATGTPSSGALIEEDDITLPDAVIPDMRVELGLAPVGTPASGVSFDVEAALNDGFFDGEIAGVDALPGDHELWARACLGAKCEATSVPVALGADPSPSGSASATPEPTESPVPETTELSFTDGSATAGQYSDETLFEATLTNSDGGPIAGAELVFELAGADSPRTFTATTDDDGIASVSPRLTERPGPHQLTVGFAGDDDHAPSADSTAFVVDKEDSGTELTVEGKGNNRILTACLSDQDTPADGIAGRTIDFYGDGELLGSATTDDDGVATLKPPPRYRGGKHDFEARFEGDDFYVASSDRETS